MKVRAFSATIWSAAVSQTSRSAFLISSCCDWLSAQSRSVVAAAAALGSFEFICVHPWLINSSK
jgi:hypothetical protein